MVFLDVVYNHFGPDGNYLYVYARDAFFTERFHTPWGAAINFSGRNSSIVREFYLANVLYWLEEYHLDGLRFDAVHSIFDQSRPDILEEIARKVREGPGSRRHIHLILENDNNSARYLAREDDGQPRSFTAQWNDDLHHACHILLTGETEGYYRDYRDRPIHHLGRCLTEGFAYQGETSAYRQNESRGEPSAHLPPLAFVSFLQNHDQIGNRALGERLIALCDRRELKILTALVLLAPSPPLLFMGEEFGAQSPFLFFCNFTGELAESVTAGRRREFAKFAQFSSPERRAHIPDPNAEETFLRSRLDWRTVGENDNNDFLRLYRQLLDLRHQAIVPRLKNREKNEAGFDILAEKALKAWWKLTDGETLAVAFNLHERAIGIDPATVGTCRPEGVDGRSGTRTRLLYRYSSGGERAWSDNSLPPRSIVWLIERRGDKNA
jgi:malto-oligosyltrehalose trehalohydrolase